MGITSPQDQTAEVRVSLQSVQNIVERLAGQLAEIKEEKKQVREMIKSFVENDPDYSVAMDAVEPILQRAKEAKAKAISSPQIVELKVKASEFREQEKEIKESLSNHLLRYREMTGSNVFETTAGDEVGFVTKAVFKPKQLSLF